MTPTVSGGQGGVSIRIEVLGETQINRKMLRFAERAGNSRVALLLIHDYLRDVSEKQFDEAGRPSGNPWAKLKQSTIERKARSRNAKTRANAERIMVATEKLRNSLVNAGDPNQQRIVTNTLMVFGTKLPYGVAHMKPGPGGRPARKPVDLSERQKLVIVKTLQLWIARGQARLMGTP